MVLSELNILNEAYYGKNKYLLECEESFSIIKQELDDNAIIKKYVSVKITEKMLDEISKVEKKIKELFNFKDVYIELVNMGQCNAYTFSDIYNPITAVNHTKNATEIGEYGIRYTDGNKKYLYVALGTELFTVGDMTPAEVVSILLHEIGHNFYDTNGSTSLAKTLGYVGLAIHDIILYLERGDVHNAMDLATMVLTPRAKLAMIDKRLIHDVDFIKKMHLLLAPLKGIANNILTILSSMLSLPFAIATFPIRFLQSFLSLVNPFAIDRFRNEKFSDNFAATYGYGVEAMKSDAKLAVSPTVSSKIPILKILDDYGGSIYLAGSFLAIPYPTTYNRIEAQIKYLKAQVNRVTDPRLKKLLNDDIKMAEKELKKCNNYIIRSAANGRLYNSVLFILLKKLDFREKLPGYKVDYSKEYKQFDKK